MNDRLLHSESLEMSGNTANAKKDVDFIWAVKIPMRDGICLNATVYKPKQVEPTPAIFTLTPYVSDTYHERGFYFSQRGYAFVLVDCRGRGNSEGHFEPFVNEDQDGHDVVEWLQFSRGAMVWSLCGAGHTLASTNG